MTAAREMDVELHRLYRRVKRNAPQRCARCGGAATWGGRTVRTLRKHDGNCLYAKHWHCLTCCARPLGLSTQQQNDRIVGKILADLFDRVQVRVT